MKNKFKKSVFLLSSLMMLSVGAGIINVAENTVNVAEAEEVSATLSFASTAQRTSFSTTQQVWEQNGITFTNNKASSTNNVANYSNPVRLYAKSNIVVSYTYNIKKIVFTCSGSSYATALKNSIESATVSGSNVTVELDGSNNSYTVASLSAQVRLSSLTVYGETGDQAKNYFYTINYNLNYSGTEVSSTQYEVGETIVEPTEKPTRNGYVFTKWYTDAECENEYVFNTVVGDLEEDITVELYAGWDPVKYNVSFETEEHITYTGNSIETNENGEIILPSVSVDDNFSFAGWYDGDVKVGNSGDVYIPTTNVTLIGKADDLYIGLIAKSSGSDSTQAPADLDAIKNLFETGSEFISNAAAATIYKGVRGIKFSSGSKAGSLSITLNETYNIKKIVASLSRFKASEAASISINDVSKDITSESILDYEFEINKETNLIQIQGKSGQRCYLKELKIYYENNTVESNTYKVSINPGIGTFVGNIDTEYEIENGKTENITLPSADKISNPYMDQGVNTTISFTSNLGTHKPGDVVEVTEATEFTAVYTYSDSSVTIAQALEICKLTGTTATTFNLTVNATVESIDTEYSEQYNNVSINLKDDSSESTILGFRVKGGKEIVVGDKISLTGKLINYNSNTPEFNAGATYKYLSEKTYMNYQYDDDTTPNAVRLIGTIINVDVTTIDSITLHFVKNDVAANKDIELYTVYESISGLEGFEKADNTYYAVYVINGVQSVLNQSLVVTMTISFNNGAEDLVATSTITLGK